MQRMTDFVPVPEHRAAHYRRAGQDGSSPPQPEARAHLAERGMARFKRPGRRETLPELPVTSVGKVDRGRLRELAAL